MFMQRNALKKAYQTLDNSLNPIEHVTESEILEQIPNLYPNV